MRLPLKYSVAWVLLVLLPRHLRMAPDLLPHSYLKIWNKLVYGKQTAICCKLSDVER